MSYSSVDILFGLPIELWVAMLAAITAAAYFYFHYNVDEVPVVVNWVYKTGTTIRLRAKEEINGIILEIKNARGKTITEIQRNGLPLEVQEIDEKNMVAYLVRFADGGKKVYLVARKGKFKSSREYTTLEGTGTTIDVLERAVSQSSGAQGSTGNTSLLHEERSGFRAFLADLAHGSTTFIDTIMGWVPGIGIGMALAFLIGALTGHPL